MGGRKSGVTLGARRGQRARGPSDSKTPTEAPWGCGLLRAIPESRRLGEATESNLGHARCDVLGGIQTQAKESSAVREARDPSWGAMVRRLVGIHGSRSPKRGQSTGDPVTGMGRRGGAGV